MLLNGRALLIVICCNFYLVNHTGTLSKQADNECMLSLDRKDTGMAKTIVIMQPFTSSARLVWLLESLTGQKFSVGVKTFGKSTHVTSDSRFVATRGHISVAFSTDFTRHAKSCDPVDGFYTR